MTTNENTGAPEPRVVFSNPELEQIRKTLDEAYGPSLERDESFKVAGAYVDEHIRLVVELANYERTRVVLFESVAELPEQQFEEYLGVRADVVEFTASMIEQYLDTERLTGLHPDWFAYDYSGREIRFRTTWTNEQVTKLADDWLAQHGDVVEDS